LLFRLRRQHADSADEALADLIEELSAYPCGPSRPRSADALATIAAPLRVRTADGILSFLSATMMFDTRCRVVNDPLRAARELWTKVATRP